MVSWRRSGAIFLHMRADSFLAARGRVPAPPSAASFSMRSRLVAQVPTHHVAIRSGQFAGFQRWTVSPPPGARWATVAAAAPYELALGHVAGPGPLLRSIAVFSFINLLGLGTSLATGSHLHLDLLGTGAFVVMAWATRGSDPRSHLSAAMIAVWSTRLASFLFYRALQLGHDARLDQTLSSPGGAVAFWVVSCIWGVITALPHTLGTGCARRPLSGLGAVAALTLCAFGLYWEVVADWQKWWFKADPANRGRFCTVGLWSLSQHPNYFGNLCFWSGIFMLNAAPLAAQGKLRLLVGALGPVFLAALFFGQASGTITNSVELAAARYSSDPAYVAYVQEVPLLVPWRL